MPQPIYTAENCKPAYQLNWTLSLFWKTTIPNPATWLADLKTATEDDGVRILEHRVNGESTSQFLVSTTPDVAPDAIIRSVKGRLQYLVRDENPKAFHRNYSILSVGSARREVVEDYVRSQLDHHVMDDDRVQDMLARHQIHCPQVDLSKPRYSSHGQYCHNLHVVFVNNGRWNEIREERLAAMRDMILTAARNKGHLLSAGGILSDHIHLALGCGISESPLRVAVGYLNNLAYALGMVPMFQYGFHVGTFGEYDLGAIRQTLGKPSVTVPRGQAPW